MTSVSGTETILVSDTTYSGSAITSNCISPFSSACSVRYDSPSRLGQYDLHLDRTGILRVIHEGQIVGTFDPSVKKKGTK